MSTQSHFLHLPNELIYRCFDYLSFNEILQSFTNLNSRITYLITTHWTSIQIDNDLRQSEFERLLYNLNPKQVRSLYLLAENDERRYIHKFLSLFSIERFENLQSLKINEVSQQFFHSFLLNLYQLPQLSTLVIHDHEDPDDSDNDELIFEQLFSNRISSLKSVTLDFILHCKSAAVQNELSSNMESLTLSCYVDHVHYFLERTPMLKKLTLDLHELYENNEQDTIVDNNFLLNIPSTLSYLKINFVGSNFYTIDTVARLFKVNSCSLSQLQHLVIIGEVHETFLDGQQWEQIIERYLPLLECFQFKFDVTNENNWNYIEYHAGDWITIDFDRIIHSFKSDFWLQRHQWFVYGQTDDETTILYTLPHCETSSLYLTTALSDKNNNRAQITSPIVPYTHTFKHIRQELTIYVNSHANSCSRLDYYYFSNVIKLCLNTEVEPENIIGLLSNIVNLNNVRRLELTYPMELNSMGLSNLLRQLSNLTSLCVWYKMTNDFTFLNSIKNKRLLKRLEIRVLTKQDFLSILEILQNNAYSLLLKLSVEGDKFENNIQQVIADWLKEQTYLTSGHETLAANFNVLSPGDKHSWITIECKQQKRNGVEEAK